MVIAVGDVDIGVLRGCGLLDGCAVVRCSKLCEVYAENAVLVLGRDAELRCDISDVFAAVVCSELCHPVERLKGVPILTCGMGARNTISVTSRTSDRMTLALNRRIATVRGCCEPMELPLSLCASSDDYDHMAAFAAAVVLGRVGAD